MQAIVFTRYGTPDEVSLQEVPRPSPGPDEVLIKVRAAALNDWDPGLIAGKPYIIRMFTGLFRPKITIPGVDVAGEVEAIGNQVQQFKIGDAVFGDLSDVGFGAFAEYVCVPEKALTRKPAAMSYADAAALPHAALLAWQGLIEKGGIQSGQRILINGAGGGVGTLAIQMVKQYDVHVTGVDSAEKLPMLSELGYDAVIDYRSQDFTEEVDRYDLVFDVKTNRPIKNYVRCLKPGGRYITVGGSMDKILAITLRGPLIARSRGKHVQVLSLQPNRGLDQMVQLYTAGKLKPVLDGVYPLENVPELIHYFVQGKHRGKVIIGL